MRELLKLLLYSSSIMITCAYSNTTGSLYSEVKYSGSYGTVGGY